MEMFIVRMRGFYFMMFILFINGKYFSVEDKVQFVIGIFIFIGLMFELLLLFVYMIVFV